MLTPERFKLPAPVFVKPPSMPLVTPLTKADEMVPAFPLATEIAAPLDNTLAVTFDTLLSGPVRVSVPPLKLTVALPVVPEPTPLVMPVVL